MKMKGTLIPLLVLSAVFAMPVFANDLNPVLVFGSQSSRQGVRLNVSTLRHDVGALRDMEGKEVRGKYNEYLGYILAVDEGGKLAEFKFRPA